MEKAIINPKEAQKGITLIALVITIIVLLILAGVSVLNSLRCGRKKECII